MYSSGSGWETVLLYLTCLAIFPFYAQAPELKLLYNKNFISFFFPCHNNSFQLCHDFTSLLASVLNIIKVIILPHFWTHL